MKDKSRGIEVSTDQKTQGRCIWMTAGVVSYKLCPYNYDCEHCDFDRAMQLQYKRKREPVQNKRERRYSTKEFTSKDAAAFFTFSVGNLPEDYYFHLAHVWVRTRGKYDWQIGIDQLLSYILPPPIGLELYNNKKELVQNEVFGKIFTTAGTVFLTTPLSGKIIQTNQNLATRPQLLQEDPLETGWLALFRWSHKRSEMKTFYTGPEAQRFLKEEACHLRHVLKYQGIEVGKTGKTLMDGGSDIHYLHQILPVKSCLELSRILIALGKVPW